MQRKVSLARKRKVGSSTDNKDNLSEKKEKGRYISEITMLKHKIQDGVCFICVIL